MIRRSFALHTYLQWMIFIFSCTLMHVMRYFLSSISILMQMTSQNLPPSPSLFLSIFLSYLIIFFIFYISSHSSLKTKRVRIRIKERLIYDNKKECKKITSTYQYYFLWWHRDGFTRWQTGCHGNGAGIESLTRWEPVDDIGC